MADHSFDLPDESTDEQDDRRLGLGAALLLVLLILALLTTLIWPVWWHWLVESQAPPTPTPTFLQQI